MNSALPVSGSALNGHLHLDCELRAPIHNVKGRVEDLRTHWSAEFNPREEEGAAE
jgi:hypothetical protein